MSEENDVPSVTITIAGLAKPDDARLNGTALSFSMPIERYSDLFAGAFSPANPQPDFLWDGAPYVLTQAILEVGPPHIVRCEAALDTRKQVFAT